MPYAQMKADLKVAMAAVGAALASGEAIVEYEIRGRKVRRKASDELLDNLEQLYARANRKSSVAGRFRLASLSRPSRRGS